MNNVIIATKLPYQAFLDSIIPEISFYSFLLLIFIILVKVLSKVVEKAFSENVAITSQLIHHSTRPIYLAIILSLTIKCTKIIFTNLEKKTEIINQILIYTPKLSGIVIIACVTTSALRFIKGLQHNSITSRKAKGLEVDIQKVDMVGKLFSIITLIIAAILLMQTFGVGFGALATVGGLGGIIVGFSTKDLFSNFFGLFSIYLDKPFVIGDEITVLDKNISGIVEDIGLRITTLRTSNNKTMVYLPNLIFNTMIIENNTRVTNKIFIQDFKVSHSDNSTGLMEFIDKLIISLRNFKFIERNPIIKITDIDDKTVTLSFKILFMPTGTENFIKQSNEIFYFLFKEFAEGNIPIISSTDRLILTES
jgi:small-conductance mechanosensitive channel